MRRVSLSPSSSRSRPKKLAPRESWCGDTPGYAQQEVANRRAAGIVFTMGVVVAALTGIGHKITRSAAVDASLRGAVERKDVPRAWSR